MSKFLPAGFTNYKNLIIPLNPPLQKGDFITPLFNKGRWGWIFEL